MASTEQNINFKWKKKTPAVLGKWSSKVPSVKLPLKPKDPPLPPKSVVIREPLPIPASKPTVKGVADKGKRRADAPQNSTGGRASSLPHLPSRVECGRPFKEVQGFALKKKALDKLKRELEATKKDLKAEKLCSDHMSWEEVFASKGKDIGELREKLDRYEHSVSSFKSKVPELSTQVEAFQGKLAEYMIWTRRNIYDEGKQA
ncbi:Uncharacterized protein Fot_19416 [Forsythia ovata]|uniref:Uncharacterized protein n=1 Tax=Forsythia ovata TaxID=205694 RepID=A0ABD1VNS4_9LAMI